MSMGYIASGTYGAVYGSPRLPCIGETYEEIKDLKQISKVFFEKHDFMIEAEVIQRLQEYLKEEQIENLKRFFILPIDVGLINYSLPVEFYQTDWLGSGPLIWKDFKLYDRTSGLIGLYQIVQEKGDCSLKQYFEKHFRQTNITETIMCLCNCMNKFQNLAVGLSTLHKHEFVHMDIKLQNCVVINDTFKFIDNGEIYHIGDLTEYFDDEKLHLMTNHPRYWVYSPHIIWARCFSIRNRGEVDMKFFCKQLIRYHKEIRDLVFQLVPLYIYLYEYNIFGLDDDGLSQIYKKLYSLFEHESCGMYVNEEYLRSLTPEKLVKIFNSSMVLGFDRIIKKQIRNFYKKGENLYGGNYEFNEKMKRRSLLLKCNDRHGFGIMILNMYLSMLDHIRTITVVENIRAYFQKYENIRKKMLNIFDIALLFVVDDGCDFDDKLFEIFSDCVQCCSIPPVLETVQTQQ